MSYKIGIVEDEYITAEYLETILNKHKYEVVFRCESGVTALCDIPKEGLDILFLDINLKEKIDGIMVARELQTKSPDTQIVFLTAYNDINTIQEASETMPSGYIVKPFEESDILIALSLAINKLKARDNNINIPQNVQLTPTIYYDIEKQIVYDNGSEVILGAKEYTAIKLFCTKIDTIVSNEELIYTVWEDKPVSLSTMRDLMYRLRQKLPNIVLKNISSTGYKLHSF